MRKLHVAALIAVTSILTGVTAFAQPPAVAATPAAAANSGPVWANPANWKGITPIVTENIIFENVPHITNPSAEASPDPGKPAGMRPPIPTTGAPGTLDMRVDVYQIPSKKPTPVILQFHGGGWIRGDRPTGYGSFEPYFVAGASVVAVQYRNAIDAPAPAAIQDIRCAMAWVKKNAKKYNFDMKRVVTWGGSAGGHLALMAAYAPKSFNPPGCTDQPKVAVALDDYGPTNLAEGLTEHGSMDFTHQWIGLDLPLAPEPPPLGSPAGRPPQPRWPEPTPAVLVRAKEMSPTTYVHHGLPPTFILNGDSDRTVDPTQSSELKKLLDDAHVPNVQDLVIGGGHGTFPPGEAQKSTLMHLQFLHDHGVIK